MKPVRPPISIDELVRQVLVDENVHGFDDQERMILINWRRDDLSQVNCSPGRCDQRGHSTRRDSANDFRDLENLYWYKALHPNDTLMDQYIARILPTVKKEWGGTIIPKGWVYFELQHMKQYSNEPGYWDHTIQNWAQTQYERIDPQSGVFHGLTDTVAGPGNIPIQDGYRIDHDLESGLALVDAGTQYQHPEWVAAGKKEVETVIKQAYSKKYHLFGHVYVISDPKYGTNRVYAPLARLGDTGQEIEALIRTGTSTHNEEYLSFAKEMLDNLQSSPLRDKVNGGFYFKLYLAPFQGHRAGEVDTGIKEARQLHTLIAVHLANKVFNNRWQALEQDLINVGMQKLFLPAPVPGFTYRVLPDGSLYPCKQCTPLAAENWNTSEADNIALQAFLNILTTKK